MHKAGKNPQLTVWRVHFASHRKKYSLVKLDMTVLWLFSSLYMGKKMLSHACRRNKVSNEVITLLSLKEGQNRDCG